MVDNNPLRKMKLILLERAIISIILLPLLALALTTTPATVFALTNSESVAAAGTAVPSTVKNIIMMIPDGGGYSLFDAANSVKAKGGFPGKKHGVIQTQPSMYMSDYLRGSLLTHSANSSVTDSAAAGTALATGKKTNNGMVGITPDMRPVANVLELAQECEKAVGVVSTKYLYDATPATYTAHVPQRYNSGDVRQQQAHQALAVYTGGVEDSLPFDLYYDQCDEDSMPPNIVELTKDAIETLSSASKNGFFLMVEGGLIDMAAHANDAPSAICEYIAFDEAFKTAVEWAKQRTDTVVIAAPDHETGGLQLPTDPDLYDSFINDLLNHNQTTANWQTMSHTGVNVGVWMYLPQNVESPAGLAPANIASASLASTNERIRTDYVIENTVIGEFIAGLIAGGYNYGESSNVYHTSEQDVTSLGRTALSEATRRLFVDVTHYSKKESVFTKYSAGTSIKTGEDYSLKSAFGDGHISWNIDEITINGNKLSSSGRPNILLNSHIYVSKQILDHIVEHNAKTATLNTNAGRIELGRGETADLCDLGYFTLNDTNLKIGAGGEKLAKVIQNSTVKALRLGCVKLLSEQKSERQGIDREVDPLDLRARFDELCKKNIVVTLLIRKAPRSISFLYKKISIKKGKTRHLSYILPKKSASNSIKFTSSVPSIVQINDTGCITALRKGLSIITVRTFNNKKARCKVRVR